MTETTRSNGCSTRSIERKRCKRITLQESFRIKNSKSLVCQETLVVFRLGMSLTLGSFSHKGISCIRIGTRSQNPKDRHIFWGFNISSSLVNTKRISLDIEGFSSHTHTYKYKFNRMFTDPSPPLLLCNVIKQDDGLCIVQTKVGWVKMCSHGVVLISHNGQGLIYRLDCKYHETPVMNLTTSRDRKTRSLYIGGKNITLLSHYLQKKKKNYSSFP